MKNNKMIKSLTSAACLLGTFAVGNAGEKTKPNVITDPSRPNIVMILIDDMGLMDLESYGSTYYETPNINKLASEGMQFNNAYAAANVCSPSRHAILTGKYPGRTRFTNVKYYKDKKAAKRKLNGVKQQDDLKESETTFAEAFKANGYNTAFIGKWHVGGKHGVKHGFDHWGNPWQGTRFRQRINPPHHSRATDLGKGQLRFPGRPDPRGVETRR